MFVFFWEEMLNESTPDTWQARTCNLKTVLHEIVHAIDVTREFEKYRHNLPVLIDEAHRLMGMDRTIAKHFPLLRNLLSKSADGPLDDIKERSVVILGRLEDYQRKVIEDTRLLLSDGDDKEKSGLNYLAMALAVGWLDIGYSAQYLRDGLDVLHDTSIPDFIDRFDRFVSRFDGVDREYLCTFRLN